MVGPKPVEPYTEWLLHKDGSTWPVDYSDLCGMNDREHRFPIDPRLTVQTERMGCEFGNVTKQ